MAKEQPSPKVERVIYGNCTDFSQADFLELAIECLDQAGLSAAGQATIEHSLKLMRGGREVIPVLIVE